MADNKWLVDRFEHDRAHLRKVAYRMLGSLSEAEDAVQEVWVRLNRSDTTRIENFSGWLTTVVARVCLDVLRSRQSRREEPLDDHIDEADSVLRREAGSHRDEAILADSISLALLTVLDTLEPSERVAFVLHDLFDLSFNEIAPVLGRSPDAARQLASRGRRRVQGAPQPAKADRAYQRRLVEAFLAASHRGDFTALLELLDSDIVLAADTTAVRMGASAEVRGAAAVARTFKGRARGARLALVDGAVGLVWAPGGRRRVIFEFATQGAKITGIKLFADRERLRQFEIIALDP